MDIQHGRYAHFTAEERPFVARVEDWLERALRNRPVCTPFLDPRQAFIVQALATHRGVACFFHGGHPQAERKRAWLSLWDPGSLMEDDFGLALLQAEPHSAASDVEHHQYLGSLLNTGMKRDKIGDLWLVPPERKAAQVVVAAEVADYLTLHWTKVGKFSMHVKRIPWSELVPPQVDVETFSANLSSLRLDAFVAEVCRLSRAKAVQLVKEQAVRVNWQVATEPDWLLQVGDRVSIRKFGRFQLLAVDGMSRKGRWRVQVGKTV